MWPAVNRAGDPKIIVHEGEEHELENRRAETIYPYAGYPLISFNEFKDMFVEKVARNIYNKLQPALRGKVDLQEFEKLVRIAAEAADKIVEERKKS